MRVLNKLLVIILVAVPLLYIGTSCNTAKQSSGKAVKETEERQEEKRERQAEKYEEARERHMEIQTKETKKRMKKMQKKSERYNYNEKKFFLVRWWEKIFNKRRRKATEPGGL